MKKSVLFLGFVLSTLIGFAQYPSFDWLSLYATTNSDKVSSICTDLNGNLIVVGQFKGTMDFDPGGGVHNVTSSDSYYYDFFIQKLSPSGTFKWVKTFRGCDARFSPVVKVDENNNIYVAGDFEGTVDFDPSYVYELKSSNGLLDIFIQKFSNSGNLLWVKTIGGSENDELSSMEIINNDILLYGRFNDTVDFDPSSGQFNLVAEAGKNNSFIAKINNHGVLKWAKHLGPANSLWPNNICCDSHGNVYTTGYFSDEMDFDPGLDTFLVDDNNGHGFLLKLDSVGQFTWVKTLESGSGYYGIDIAIDKNDDLFLTGNFADTADLDPDTTVALGISKGWTDVFVEKLSNDGQLIWLKTFGGNQGDVGLGIAVDHESRVYTTGYFHNTVDFDPGSGSNSVTSSGEYDIFIQKLRSNGDFLWAAGFGGDSWDKPFDIHVDEYHSLYFTGVFHNFVTFDPWTGSNQIVSIGSYDAFVEKLNVNVGLEEINSNEVKIYPNPARGDLIVDVLSGESFALKIYDLQGKIVYSATGQNGKKLKLDLPSGVYIVNINLGEKSVNQKLIIQ